MASGLTLSLMIICRQEMDVSCLCDQTMTTNFGQPFWKKHTQSFMEAMKLSGKAFNRLNTVA